MSSTLFTIPMTTKLLIGFLPIYIFLLKFFKAEQARKINQIGKEVFSINSLCVEFYIKYYTYLLLPQLSLDKKEQVLLIQSLHLIRFRIATHMANIDQLYRNYPFGTAINYLLPYRWFEWIYNISFLRKYKSIASHRFQFEFSKSVYFDTIKSKGIFEKEVSLNNNIDSLLGKISSQQSENLQKLPPIFTDSMDEIIEKGVSMVHILENNVKKALW